MASSSEITAAYRKLGQEIAENEDEMVRPESDSLVGALKKGNKLHENVTTASEGAEDSKLMTQLAKLYRNKVQELKTDSAHFRAVEFGEKVAAYALQGNTGTMRAEHWTALGQAAQPFFKRPPACSFLLGSFAKEPQQKKERAKARMKDDRSSANSTAVKKIVSNEESLETTAHDVTKRVLPTLVEYYKYNGKVPIDYYEFVIDPNSFGATVENMFHVSFLIRDGYAEISLDEEGLPAIRPTIYGLDVDGTLEGRERELQAMSRKQVVNPITMNQWRNIIRTFKITKARIPPRHRP